MSDNMQESSSSTFCHPYRNGNLWPNDKAPYRRRTESATLVLQHQILILVIHHHLFLYKLPSGYTTLEYGYSHNITKSRI
jgi:hypothetical protein